MKDARYHNSFLTTYAGALDQVGQLPGFPSDVKEALSLCIADLHEKRLDRIPSYQEKFRQLTWRYEWNKTEPGIITGLLMMLMAALDCLGDPPKVIAPLVYRSGGGRVFHAIREGKPGTPALTYCGVLIPGDSTKEPHEGVVTCKRCASLVDDESQD